MAKIVVVYKRTHSGDPDRNGCFGVYDCMGSVRGWNYDAVIGVGGIGTEPKANGIAGKVNWIGIGPLKKPAHRMRGPFVTFDHFYNFGTDGPDFRTLAPRLAERMYSKNVRHLMTDVCEQEHREEINILRLAKDAPPSRGRFAKHDRACRIHGCAAADPTKLCF